MKEPLAELAAYSCPWYQVPDADLVRLTAAARVAGHRWDAIATACDNGPGQDIPAVIRQQYWISPGTGPGPLFSATQRAARNLTGRDAGYFPPLTWPCPGCGQQVTDLAPGGRPIHAELGETLRRDQARLAYLDQMPPTGSIRHVLGMREPGPACSRSHLQPRRRPGNRWSLPGPAAVGQGRQRGP